jgi:hypothetical protein
MIKQIIAKMVFNMLVAVGRVNLVRQIYLCEQQ